MICRYVIYIHNGILFRNRILHNKFCLLLPHGYNHLKLGEESHTLHILPKDILRNKSRGIYLACG